MNTNPLQTWLASDSFNVGLNMLSLYALPRAMSVFMQQQSVTQVLGVAHSHQQDFGMTDNFKLLFFATTPISQCLAATSVFAHKIQASLYQLGRGQQTEVK